MRRFLGLHIISIHTKFVKQWKLNQVKHGKDGIISFAYIMNATPFVTFVVK
jgi:hypothetical protein